MDTASTNNKSKDSGEVKDGDENSTCQVVMRKSRNVYESADTDTVSSKNAHDDDGKKKKHVKWSESTELRERQKVYRRSQLDIPLDYHHLAVEEEREKEGVHLWRNHLVNEDVDEDVDEKINKFVETYAAVVTAGVQATAAELAGSHVGDAILPNYDSDENDPDFDEDMERNIQIIKEETTRFTLFPAYSAAIPAYEEWLSNSEDAKELTEAQKAAMTSQLELYKRLISIYKEWTKQTSKDFPRESRFGDITSILQEASNLVQPPSCVSKIIREVLTDEENIQKQVDAYNSQVQEMIAALDIKSKV
ncbi:hypothetical protein BsWGS_24173 [Bradybaena similaris]